MTFTPPTSKMSMPLSVSPFLYPLDEFYAQANRCLPAIESLAGEQIPEPYKSLLVHSKDMTSTLERFHGESVHLKVLSRQQCDDFYFREVVLVMDQAGLPVEFGAIKINLVLFPPHARRQILQEQHPLGHILEEQKISYVSRPKAFLKVGSDSFIEGALSLPAPSFVFARRNALLDSAQRPMAEVLEILPPISNGNAQKESI